MKALTALLFVLCGVLRTAAHPSNSTFHHLVCQQCSSWCSPEPTVVRVSSRIGKAGPRGPIGPRGFPGIVNMTAVEDIINRKIEKAIGYFAIRDCRDISIEKAKSRNERGGVFDIFIPSKVGMTEVYCDVTSDGGDWIVFQRRMDGSVDFYRNWDDYVTGFGDVRGEFWLGLEAIHQLTKNGLHELRVDMIARDGTHYYAKYSNFKVAASWDDFRLTVTGYSGNATDSMSRPRGSYGIINNQKFSTKDQDNDSSSSENCAISYKGGWWYNRCQCSNLNGLYNEASHWRGIIWLNDATSTPVFMKYTEMKFRLKQ